jgi:predicted aconitase with swiveling domain
MSYTSEFNGRVILAHADSGEAAVTRSGFNATAAFMDVLFQGSDSAVCQDHDNEDLFGVDLQGKILCVPQTIGSSAAATLWMIIVERGIAPRAVLFSDSIDSVAACGLVLANNWADGAPIICIDQLGDDFLESVNTGDRVEICEDGRVRVYH